MFNNTKKTFQWQGFVLSFLLSCVSATSLEAASPRQMVKEGALLISNDSGPIHIGAGVATPIIGIFGPTHIGSTGPIGRGKMRLLQQRVGCEIPCYFDECHHHLCMTNLSVDRVIEAVDELLGVGHRA